MCAYALGMCLVLLVRRGQWIPLKLELEMVAKHHAYAENKACSLLPDLFFTEVRKTRS